jgi:alpha-glucosidase
MEIARNALGGLINPRSARRRLRLLGERLAYHRPAAGTPLYLGDVESYSLHERSIDVVARSGALRLTSLGPGIVQVRLGRAGVFEAAHSYALTPDAFEGGGPFLVSADTQSELRLSCPGVTVVIGKQPCRISFIDEAGRLMSDDLNGAGWQGDAVICSLKLDLTRSVYGLGEKAFNLNHRGRRLTLWNTDPRGGRYARGTDPIYTNIPLVLFREAGMAYGMLFDNTYRAVFDIGRSQGDEFRYWAAGGELSYLLLSGPTLSDVLSRYADLTGHMALPPLWALGYHQCRWGYVDESDIRRVTQALRQHRIPCDAIYLDIDYMDGYRVFTVDRSRFSDLPGLVEELASDGFHTVAIINPGVKVDPDYHVCAEGLAQDMLLKLPSGMLYSGPVWPGECYFPDFASSRVRTWWGNLYRPLVEAGVAGFWNDMNEPAVFPSTTLPDAVQHAADAGPTDHRALHNVYGQLMAEASADGLRRARPADRPFLISRAGYAGIQRTALTWTGDNASSWEHLRLSIPMVLNLGLSGQPFSGADVGGFNGDATGELMARWTQLGAFLPFFRNHNGAPNAPQEVYVFGDPFESICRRFIEWRYRLLP